MDRSTDSQIVNNDGVVPAGRDDHIPVRGVELHAEDPIVVAGVLSKFFHLEAHTLGGLVVDPDVLVFSGGGQKRSVAVEIEAVKMVLFIVTALMEAFSRGSVPMFEDTVGLTGDQHIVSFQGLGLGPPREISHRHGVVA